MYVNFISIHHVFCIILGLIVDKWNGLSHGMLKPYCSHTHNIITIIIIIIVVNVICNRKIRNWIWKMDSYYIYLVVHVYHKTHTHDRHVYGKRKGLNGFVGMACEIVAHRTWFHYSHAKRLLLPLAQQMNTNWNLYRPQYLTVQTTRDRSNQQKQKRNQKKKKNRWKGKKTVRFVGCGFKDHMPIMCEKRYASIHEYI